MDFPKKNERKRSQTYRLFEKERDIQESEVQ